MHTLVRRPNAALSRNRRPGHTMKSIDPPALRISLLGGFELRCGAELVAVRSTRIRSLLAWLALRCDEPQPRVRVASALWPESAEGQARTNLRNLIHQLRRAFPEIERYLDCEGAALAWRHGSPVAVDVRELERALSSAGANETSSERAIEEALPLYRGPLLPDHYEPWLTSERERIRRLFLDGLDAVLRQRVRTNDHTGSRIIADHILVHDPLREQAHRAKISALAALGDRAGALRAFNECKSVLESELGVEPAEATLAAWRAAVGDPTADAATVPDRNVPVPPGADAAERLVGRHRELSYLRSVHARALESHTTAVLVVGDAGIGKSLLVQTFADGLEREGGRIVRVRAYRTTGALAYGPVIACLRSSALRAAVAAAAPETRSQLRRLLPELGPPVSPDDEALTESELRQRLHDAVISVLSHPRGPAVLVVDDLQWADLETIDVLSSIIDRTPRPLLLVAMLRTGEGGPDHPLEDAGSQLPATGRLERLELEPLGLEDTGELMTHLLGREVHEEDVRALHRETEGNPLFIVETARSGRSWGDAGVRGPGQDTLSPRIRAVIEGRLALLSAESRAVIQVAATIGREFTIPLLLAASPLDEQATLRGLDEAWRRYIVREREGGSWDFSHGRIQEVAYRTTSPIRRRSHHQRIAAVLERAASGTAAPTEATLDQIALHHDLGGSVASAVSWYRRAARSAMDVSGLDASRQLLGRALEILERLPGGPERDQQELDMRLNLGPVLVALEGYGRAGTVETYERAMALCHRLGRPVTPPILRALALASLARGNLIDGTRYGDELTRAAEREADPVARVEGEYVCGVMAFWNADLPEAERRLSRAIEAYVPGHHRDHVLLYAQDPAVVCLSRLAWTLWHRGRVAEALARRDEALERAESHGDPMGLAYAHWFTLFIAIEQGDSVRLAAQIAALKRVAAAHRLLYPETVADGFLGYLDAVRGDARGGIARMRAILADRRWHGMEYVLKLQTLYLIARAAAGAGDCLTARQSVGEALDYIGSAPSIWIPPLRHVDARAIAAEDRTGDHALPAFAGALAAARACGSVWTELCVAVDRARWTLGLRTADHAPARADLERALAFYDSAPTLPAVEAGRIILERLAQAGDT